MSDTQGGVSASIGLSPAEIGIEIDAIATLKARYFRLMDTKRWDEWQALFASDALIGPLDTGIPGIGVMRQQDVKEFVVASRANLDAAVTIHHGHLPELELASPTSARGIWAMDDLLEFPPGAPLRRVHGYGHYHDTYSKIDGSWKIQTMRITRLRVSIE